MNQRRQGPSERNGLKTLATDRKIRKCVFGSLIASRSLNVLTAQNSWSPVELMNGVVDCCRQSSGICKFSAGGLSFPCKIEFGIPSHGREAQRPPGLRAHAARTGF